MLRRVINRWRWHTTRIILWICRRWRDYYLLSFLFYFCLCLSWQLRIYDHSVLVQIAKY